MINDEYKAAIEKYNTNPWYVRIETAASIFIIALQVITTIKLFHYPISINIIYFSIIFFLAFIATDFINGLVHMIVDNNTNYTSLTGPYVAAFHLHHLKIIYKNKHPLQIYFYETGHKLWLFFYLVILFLVQHYININFYLDLFLVLIGVLSSVSELSHYWCHNGAKNNRTIRFLQKYRILLSMKHHRFHHSEDNKHYAFLNGMTDYFLNVIAKHFYRGYKQHADQHVKDSIS